MPGVVGVVNYCEIFHKNDKMSHIYSTLRKSRNYIVVPRDVPPENFISVPETQKERKTGLVRCLLIPVLVFLVIAGLL